MNVPVVFATDHNFIMPTGVAIQSLLECSTDVHCEIYVLQSETVSEEDRENLRSIVTPFDARIQFLAVGGGFDNCFEIRGITKVTYFRLYIPWLLPDLDKVIYCDGDVIFKKSISCIFKYDLGDNFLAGSKGPEYITNRHSKKYIESLGLNPNEYINSGVQIINSEAQRKYNLKSKYQEHFSKKYRYQDQDIVNIVCKGKILHLPLECNSLSCKVVNERIQQWCDYNHIKYEDVALSLSSPILIHYRGAKPWNKFTYSWVDWWSVYEQSLFFVDKLEEHIYSGTYNVSLSFSQFILLLFKQRFPKFYKWLSLHLRRG
jgi:lipopolysaccharide biosynthesis glycosyltransferase